MTEGNEQKNINNATSDELLVSLYSDLKKSKEQIDKLTQVNKSLKK